MAEYTVPAYFAAPCRLRATVSGTECRHAAGTTARLGGMRDSLSSSNVPPHRRMCGGPCRAGRRDSCQSPFAAPLHSVATMFAGASRIDNPRSIYP